MFRIRQIGENQSYRTIVALLLLLLPFVVVVLLTGLNHPFDFDEGDYHIPVIMNFVETLPTPDLVNYNSATTPLMHLTLASWGSLVGVEPWKLRLPVLLAGMLSVVVFYFTVRERGDPHPPLLTAYFIAYPYVFWLSFLVMTEVFSLLFGLLALRHFLHRPTRRRDLLLFALWASLAILSRQQWLFLPVGAGLYWLWQDRNLRRAAWAAVPLLAFLPFFLLWGGMAPPLNFATSHEITLNLVQIPHLLIAVGFYFAIALFTAPIDWKKLALVALILLPFFLVAPQIEALPESWSILPMQREFAGSMARMSALIARFLPAALLYLGYLMLFVLGGVILAQAWLRRHADEAIALWFLVGAFLLSLLAVAQAWERYLLPIIPVLILMLYAYQRPRRWLTFVWLPVQWLLLAGFMWYQLTG